MLRLAHRLQLVNIEVNWTAPAMTGILCLLNLGMFILPLEYYSPHFQGSPKLYSICAIQGEESESPYQNQTVRVRGIVFADSDETSWKGFFIQEEDCDGDPTTSDGIFIYLGIPGNVVQNGDRIEATGIVQEYAGMTEIRSAPDQVVIMSRGLPLPAMVELNPPYDELSALKYYESLEGMYGAVQDAHVVGPTNRSAQTWVVRADLEVTRVFQDDPRGTGVVINVASSMNPSLSPYAKCGDHLNHLKGIISENMGVYALDLLEAPPLIPSPLPEPVETSPGNGLFSVATFNLSNLFDSTDDPTTADDVLSAHEYQRKLSKRALAIHSVLDEPDILALQEGENLPVYTALSLRPEIAADYDIAWEESPDLRGQDIAVLYRGDRMTLLEKRSYQGCTGLVDGLGPDGNQDVLNPDNAITCDRNGDGSLDGNRLFSRPPLVARFNLQAKPPGYPEPFELIVVANHWKSKVEDTDQISYTHARRYEEAVFVSELVAQLAVQAPGAMILVLGDLNDYPSSGPLTTLKSGGLVDLSSQIGRSQRYTYIHKGISQMLDYVLVTPLMQIGGRVVPEHINADYPAVFEEVADTVYRSSDHDLLRADFYWLPESVYLPLIFSDD